VRTTPPDNRAYASGSSADPVVLAQALLRFPSITPAEAGALRFIDGVLSRAGFRTHRPVFKEAGTPDVENLYARIGTGAPYLVFAGHTDVVPAGDARWRHDPFGGTIESGVLYGRGACDMKGAIGCMLAATLGFLAAHPSFGGSIGFLITGDEEGPAVNGSVKLLQWAARNGERFDHCILGEPTNPQALGDMIKIGRRGSLTGRLVVHGRQGHVAYPHLADNAVRGMVRLLDALMAHPLDGGSAEFDPSSLEVTTVDVGNTAENVIPGGARAQFNIRFNDRWTPDSLEREVVQRLDAAAAGRVRYDIDFHRNSVSFLTQRSDFVELVATAIEAETGRRPQLSTSGGTSDARFIKDYCPVVEFGLVGATMHQTDERVAVADLERLTAIYRRILDAYFVAG
jgi:succinyl-diaminopimelate desuccinylase